MQSFLTVAGKVDIQSKIFNAFSSVPLKLLPKKVVLMIEMIPISSYGEWLLTASRSRKQTANLVRPTRNLLDSTSYLSLLFGKNDCLLLSYGPCQWGKEFGM